jgi:26S proteasome regulatory subunit T4
MVRVSSGPRYIVGCRPKIDRALLKPGIRCTLDITTYTIMSILPREVDPTVHSMSAEDPGDVKYADVGGLTNQIRDLRETIELPLTNPELF